MNLKTKLTLVFAILFNLATFAQETITVKGVVSSDGAPLPEANVLIQGTTKGVSTDFNGNYKIEVKKGDVLLFSYFGFETKTVKVENQREINVSLSENATQLKDVVVVGYGTMKKDNVTGAVSTFKTDILNDLPVSRIDQALQGRLAGVQVQNTSSEAGSDPTIQIRGIASINANAQPLVVVDGQPIQDGLSSLNIADIQDVTVLKDAASAAIYGSRGANGVILVTTKSGLESKTKFAFNYSFGLKSAYKRWDISTMTDYIHRSLNENVLRLAEGITASPVNNNRRAAYYIENFLSDGPEDYQDQFLRTGQVSNIQLNASGGTKGFKYFVSGGVNLEEGLTIKSDYTRYNFRTKLNVDLTKRIKLDVNINPSYAKTQKPLISDLNNFLRGQSWIPTRLNQRTVDFILNQPLAGANTFYNKADVYVGAFAHPQFFRNMTVPAYNYIGPLDNGAVTTSALMTNQSAWTTSASNPLFSIYASDDDREDFRIQTNIGLSINLAEGLDFKTSFSYYSKFSNRLQFNGSRAGVYGAANVTNANSAQYSNDKFVDLLTENLLTYKKTFNNVHSIDVTALYSAQKTIVNESDTFGAFFPNDKIRTLNAGRTDSYFATGTTNRLGLISYMGRINYSYKDKYDLSASIRTDGSSLFSKENQWAVFPAVSVGWNVAKEKFIEDKLDWMNKLKIRGSYGATGNNRIETISNLTNSYNPSVNIFDYASYITGTGNGSVSTGLALPNVFPNANLTWETTLQTNIGVDLSILKNRFNISVDYYNSNTNDLLLLESTRAFTGAPQSWINVGKLNNKGLEFELSTININKGKFTWSTSANYSRNVNELKDFGTLNRVENINSAALLNLGTSSFSDYYLTEVGRPLVQLFGYKTDGVWLSQSQINDALAGGLVNTVGSLVPGALKIVDLNGDNIINESDRTVIGDPYADFTWGITNNFKIGGLDIAFTLQGVQGLDVYNGESISNEAKQYVNNFTNNRYISPSNPGNGTPFELNGNIKWQLTDYAVEDGSYWKLNDITIGYTLGKDLVKKIGLSKFRFYISAQNLYYNFAEGYKGINPEARNTRGTNPLTTGFLQYQSFAIPKTISSGLEINF